MKTIFRVIRRFAMTALAITAACVVGYRLWTYYMDEPWTRD